MLTILFVGLFIVFATGTFGATMGGGIYITDKILARREDKAKAIEANKTPKPAYYDCVVSTERLLEEKLVDSGAMKLSEMTVCEDKNCPNCEPTRFQIQGERDAQAAIWRFEQKRQRAAELEKERAQEAEHKRKREALLKAEREERQRHNMYMAQRETQRQRKRLAVVDDRYVPLPNNVPRRAVGKHRYNPEWIRDEILWTWEEDGREMAYLVRLPVGEWDRFDRVDRKNFLRAQALNANEIRAVLSLPESEVCECRYDVIEIDQFHKPIATFYNMCHTCEAPEIRTQRFRR